MLDRLLGRCYACHGKGYVIEWVEVELTGPEWIETLVNGGYVVRPERNVCTDCNGSGKKNG